MWQSVDGYPQVAVSWCSDFPRSRWFWRRPPALRYAYRPPALFADTVSRDARVFIWGVDRTASAERMLDAHPAVDVLYVSTHGTHAADGYRTLFEVADWLPSHGRVPCRVLVLDTCQLATDANGWASGWQSSDIGLEVRLVLGFRGDAAGDRASADRASAFAENLMRDRPVVNAWFDAVISTRVTEYDRPAAIALGDDLDDANYMADFALMSNLAPRSRRTPVAVIRQ